MRGLAAEWFGRAEDTTSLGSNIDISAAPALAPLLLRHRPASRAQVCFFVKARMQDIGTATFFNIT
jgi:hypothetical protein